MGCCGDDRKNENPGVVVKRKCRDVLCLIFFIVWWCGMFVIAYFAYREGDTDRLVYGSDMYGLTCGHNQTFLDQPIDLSDQKNTYYLNPLALLSIRNIPYAKRVCVEECPTTPICNASSFPCEDYQQFVCPYYRVAEYNLYGQMPGVSDTNTTYYGELSTIGTFTPDTAQASFINAVDALNVPWIDTFLSSNGITDSSTDGTYYQLTSQFPDKGPCYPVYVETASYFNRCVPKITTDFTQNIQRTVDGETEQVDGGARDALLDLWQSLGERFARYTADISKGILIIIVGGVIAGLLLSVLYLVFMRFAAGILVWVTLILVNVALLGITLYSFAMADMLGDWSWVNTVVDELKEVGNPAAVDQEVWKWIGVTAAILTGLFFLLTLLMLSRLRIAVACIKVASQALAACPLLLVWPLIPFLLLLLLVLYWVAVSAMLYSAGDLSATCRDPADWQSYNFDSLSGLDPEQLISNATAFDLGATTSCYEDYAGDLLRQVCGVDANCYVSYRWNDSIRYAFLYHFYGLLWTSQVIVGISCVVVAATVGQFYWAGGDTNKMTTYPISTGAKYAFIFSLGSICFGASIIAILMWIRFVLVFIDNRLKALSAESVCAKWFSACVCCCLWVIQKIVEFINRNAYIMVAIKGSNYCVSAGRAVALIVTNALRLLTVNIVGDTLLFLGKVAIAASCGVFAFFVAELDYYTNSERYPKTYLSSPFWPVFLSVLIAYFIAEVFLSVYELAIDTILLCLCDDCDTHGGEPALAPPILLDAMGVDEADTSAAIVKHNQVAPTDGY